MKRRLLLVLAVLLVVLPAGAGAIAAVATPDPGAPGVAPTIVGVQPVGTVDLSPGMAPTILPGQGNGAGSTAVGAAPTIGGVPVVLPPGATPPPGATLPQGGGTATASGTPTGTAAVGTATATATVASSATPSGTASASATPCATGAASSTATATASPCATSTATATIAPPTTACTPATASLAASPLAPAAGTKDVASARTQTTRTFDLGNGKFQTVIGMGSVNYQDAQGKWQPIDNTLVASGTAGYAYQNRANAYSVALPSDLGANPVKVTKGNQWVSFALEGAKGTSTTCDNQVTYANVLSSVTAKYAAGNDAVTETLTLASASAPNSYAYTVQSSGLTARTANSGIEFVDGAGAVQFAFTPPTMHDHTGKSGKVALALVGGTTVTMTADPAWLKDAARVYPVIIDPDLTVSPLLASQDCFIVGSDPTNNRCPAGYGLNSVLWDATNGGNHSLLKFDTGGFNTNFAITGAYVYMALATYDDGTSDPSGYDNVGVRRLKTDWNASTVTWNSPWHNPGAVNSSHLDSDVAEANRNVGTSDHPEVSSGTNPDGQPLWDCTFGRFCSWTVTNMVQGWINSSYPNDGMIFEDDQSGDSNEMRFCTSSTSYCGAGWQPYLTITYQGVPAGGTIKPDLGSRPFYAIAGSQLDDRMSVGVNAVSGNLLVEASDLSLPGIGMDFAVTRTYNSRGIYRGAFGDHWSMNSGADLWLSIYPNGDIVLQGTTGFETGFVKSGSTWTKPNGLDADLTSVTGTYAYQLLYHASKTAYLFDSNGRLGQIKDRNGNTITYNYSGSTRQLTTAVDTEGRTITFTYNTSGFIASITVGGDPMSGRQWQYGYTGTNLTSVTEMVTSTTATRVTQFAYDGTTGNLASITDPRGKVTSFGYEGGARTRLTSLTRAGLTTTFAYSAGSDLAGTTTISDATPTHNQTILTYGADGLITQSKDAAGNHYDYVYNTNRKITSITDALGHATTYAYASDNERLTDVTLPVEPGTTVGAHTHTDYADAQGCPYLPYQVTDAQNRVVRYTYDNGTNCNQTVVNADPSGLGYTTTTTYNSNGTVASVQNARLYTTTLSYTFSGSLLTQIVAHPPTMAGGTQLGTVTTALDAVGRKTSLTDGKGQATSYAYDYLDRTTSVTFAGPDTVQYTYDLDSNLLTRAESAGTSTFTYDDLNRQLTKTLPSGPYLGSGHSVEYAYDNVGNLTTYADAGGTVTYGYNSRNLLASLAEPGGSCTGTVSLCTTFAYDANGQHTVTTYPGGTHLSLVYDNAQRLTTICAKAGADCDATTAGVLTRSTYSYLNGTSDTAMRQSVVDAYANTTTTYTYDAVNRLVGAHAVTTGTTTQKSDYQYGYDANGNRTSTTIGGAGTTAQFNEVDEQVNWNIGATRTYTYDANGNETGSSAGEARSYNSRNQTISITGLNGTLTPIGYLDGGQGERTSAGGSTYLNSSLGVNIETKGGASTYYTRTPSGHLVSQRTPSATYYYLFDGLGSVVALVDASGVVQARYAYDPYGQTVVKTGAAADGNPWRYTGAYLDSTGLYKMGARYYDPSRGRFTQLDPAGTGYVYASDDPVNFIDPSGLFAGYAGSLSGGSEFAPSGGAYAEGGVTPDGRIFINVFIPADDGTIPSAVGKISGTYAPSLDSGFAGDFNFPVSGEFRLEYVAEVNGYVGNYISQNPSLPGEYYIQVTVPFVEPYTGRVGRYTTDPGGVLIVR